MVTPCQLFAVSDSEAMAALPKLFQDVTSELVAAYEVGPKPVVATALAISAAALGGSVTVQVPQFGRHVTPAFNLGLLLQGGRSPGWLNLLRARLFGLIIDMKTCFSQSGYRRFILTFVGTHEISDFLNRIRSDQRTLSIHYLMRQSLHGNFFF